MSIQSILVIALPVNDSSCANRLALFASVESARVFASQFFVVDTTSSNGTIVFRGLVNFGRLLFIKVSKGSADFVSNCSPILVVVDVSPFPKKILCLLSAVVISSPPLLPLAPSLLLHLPSSALVVVAGAFRLFAPTAPTAAVVGIPPPVV